MAVLATAVFVAVEVVAFAAAEVAASGVAAAPFMAVVSTVAARCSVAAVFAPARPSIAEAATVLPRQELLGIIMSARGESIFIIATTFARATMATRRSTIRSAITRAGSARWSGPITARARSAAIAHGITTTGAIAIACRSTGEFMSAG